MLDVLLFGALTKHATGLAMLDEKQPAAPFVVKVYHDLKQTMVEFNIWGLFQPSGSLMTLSKVRKHCFLTKKSSDKVLASGNSGIAM
jgi:hypothetical protein